MRRSWMWMAGLVAAGWCEAAPLRVVASTTLIADVARQVAGPGQPVESLLPADLDPHAFHPTPREVAALARADLILVNGLGLEHFLGDLLKVAGSGRVAVVSRTITPRDLAACTHGDEDGHAHEHHHHGEEDPHVWFDPTLVAQWAGVVAEELARRQPAEAAALRARAAAYGQRLAELDTWARQRLQRVPPARRKLVTNHDAFGYFAARYGFEVVGCVLPGFSTAAEASAQDMARLHDTIRKAGVPAIFVERGEQGGVSARVAAATGAQVVELNTCALSGPGGGADSYESFFRQLVETVARHLEP